MTGYEGVLLDLLDLITEESEGMARYYIGIDGISGAGKTLLADLLAERLGASVIRTDDFYLPLAERTEERTSLPGWTMDYERFGREVALPAMERREIAYRRFDCRTQSLGEPVPIPADARYVIVEGCYALHPEIPDIYDLRIALTADNEVCERRILRRDGEERLARFINEWFPLERMYLEEYMIDILADYTVDTSELDELV